MSANHTKPLTTNQSTTTTTTSTQSSNKRSWVSNYYDYNLAEIHDSRGGFITPTTDDGGQRKLQEHNSNPSKRSKTLSYLDYVPALDADSAPHCIECKSTDLDFRYQDHFSVNVCWTCKEKKPEKYALLTKTEAKYDYLITDEELKDSILFPKVWRKKNPTKTTYHDMYLYLRMHVEQYAIEKHGSLQAMDLEFERRQADKVQRKEVVFQKKLVQLRNSTRTSIWASKMGNTGSTSAPHTHSFQPSSACLGKLVCECGMQVDGEVLDDDDDDDFDSGSD